MDVAIINETRAIGDTVGEVKLLSIQCLMDACRIRNYYGLSKEQIGYLSDVQKTLREFCTSSHSVKIRDKKLEITSKNADKITELIKQYYDSVIKSIEECQKFLSEQELLSGVLDKIKDAFNDYFLTTI